MHYSQSYESVEFVYTNVDLIRIPSTIQHTALNDLNIAMQVLLGIGLLQPFSLGNLKLHQIGLDWMEYGKFYHSNQDTFNSVLNGKNLERWFIIPWFSFVLMIF